MIQEITIRYGNDRGYDVLKDGLSSGGGMNVGEMIEQVLSLTLASATVKPFSNGRPVYAMKPYDEWGMSNPQREDFEVPVFHDDVGSGA